jgi:outer membrane biosynthesis protein TonB
MPARLARLLRTGGDLDIRLEPAATGERGLRYRLPVPASAASLDQALSACGQPLADEWDSRPRFPMDARAWASQALPEYPNAAIQRDIPVATVELACVVAAEGRLSECRVLSENPEGLGFGRNALEAARRSRLNVPEDDTSSVGEIAQYVARFLGPAN